MTDQYGKYLAALLDGDRRMCRDIVEDLVRREVPVRTLYEDLFQTSLYRVGELWESRQITVATEHLATAITESLMTLVYPVIFEAPHSGQCAVVSCAANEYHQIGGKMVADTFELNGWHGHFLGANTPVQDLLDLIDSKRPDVVALSITVYFSMPELLAAAREVRSEFADIPIWVGGQALRWGGAEAMREIPGIAALGSLSDLETRLATWGETDA